MVMGIRIPKSHTKTLAPALQGICNPAETTWRIFNPHNKRCGITNYYMRRFALPYSISIKSVY